MGGEAPRRLKVKVALFPRSHTSNMAFITDISISIDEASYPEPGTLRSLLQRYNVVKEGSCYRVGGSFEDLDQLSVRLQHMCPTSSRAQLKPLHVSALVMTYIEERSARKIKEMRENTCVIETVPNLKTVHGTPNCTIQVTFRPIHPATRPVQVDFVRQRFISLYQRTASDLQVISVPSTDGYRNLERRFPLLLFRQKSKSEITVIGPYGNIAKLKEFLSQNRQSPSEGPAPGTAHSPRSRHVGASPPPREDPDTESCPICMEPIVAEEKETLRCAHSFCRGCLRTAFDYKPVCPTCGRIYGTMTGTQPDGGEMNVTQSSASLPGYEKYGTIVIHYYIPSGIQKAEHPNPGQPYSGASRTAYLPDCPQGRAVQKLLRRAFRQRLVFTVGRSTTSGSNNVVTWNDIHHKTSTHGGPTRYGYPDPDYLDRIQQELAAKGIE